MAPNIKHRTPQNRRTLPRLNNHTIIQPHPPPWNSNRRRLLLQNRSQKHPLSPRTRRLQKRIRKNDTPNHSSNNTHSHDRITLRQIPRRRTRATPNHRNNLHHRRNPCLHVKTRQRKHRKHHLPNRSDNGNRTRPSNIPRTLKKRSNHFHRAPSWIETRKSLQIQLSPLNPRHTRRHTRGSLQRLWTNRHLRHRLNRTSRRSCHRNGRRLHRHQTGLKNSCHKKIPLLRILHLAARRSTDNSRANWPLTT